MNDTYERNAEIWAAKERGETAKAIGKRFGIGAARVDQIHWKHQLQLDREKAIAEEASLPWQQRRVEFCDVSTRIRTALINAGYFNMEQVAGDLTNDKLRHGTVANFGEGAEAELRAWIAAQGAPMFHQDFHLTFRQRREKWRLSSLRLRLFDIDAEIAAKQAERERVTRQISKLESIYGKA